MEHLVLFAILAVLLWAAWSDVAIRIIPTGACIALVALGSFLRARNGPAALVSSTGIAVLLFSALALLHARGIIGGGDVKLAAGVALGLPALGVLHFIQITTLAGGVLAFLYLLLRHLPHPAPCAAAASVLRRVCSAERWRIRRRGPLPYGVAIACGGASAFLSCFGN
jgi:prepilin peptidase CpaA